jgi:hypothetical protein
VQSFPTIAQTSGSPPLDLIAVDTAWVPLSDRDLHLDLNAGVGASISPFRYGDRIGSLNNIDLESNPPNLWAVVDGTTEEWRKGTPFTYREELSVTLNDDVRRPDLLVNATPTGTETLEFDGASPGSEAEEDIGIALRRRLDPLVPGSLDSAFRRAGTDAAVRAMTEFLGRPRVAAVPATAVCCQHAGWGSGTVRSEFCRSSPTSTW